MRKYGWIIIFHHWKNTWKSNLCLFIHHLKYHRMYTVWRVAFYQFKCWVNNHLWTSPSPPAESSRVVEESSDCQLRLHSVQMVRAEPLSPKASRCSSQLGSTCSVAMWASPCALYAVCGLFLHHKCLVLLLFYKWGIGSTEKANNMPKVSWLGYSGTRIQSQICPVLKSTPMSSILGLPQWLSGI